MQFYDLVMLVVMGGAIFFGFWKGFAWQVASLGAIFASYFVARNFHQPVADMIGGDPSWNRFLAMFILFMGTSLVIWVGFGFVKSNIEKMHLKSFDRQVGAVLGAGKGFILCTLITLFSVSLLGENTCRSVCTSKSGNYIARILGSVGGLVPPEIGKHINPYIEKFQKEMDDHKNDLPPNQQQPPQFQQPQNNGGFRPNQQNPWGSPNMTQGNTNPNESYGQWQPTGQGGQYPPRQQPVYNGSWQNPAPNQNQNAAQQLPQQNNGGFPAVPASWKEAGQNILQDAKQKALEEVWRRTMNGNQ